MDGDPDDEDAEASISKESESTMELVNKMLKCDVGLWLCRRSVGRLFLRVVLRHLFVLDISTVLYTSIIKLYYIHVSILHISTCSWILVFFFNSDFFFYKNNTGGGRGSVVVKTMNVMKSKDARDALAKAIYNKLFDWLGQLLLLLLLCLLKYLLFFFLTCVHDYHQLIFIFLFFFFSYFFVVLYS